MPLRARAYIGSRGEIDLAFAVVQHDRPAVGLDQPDDHVKRRRLSGAVGTEQSDDFAGLHFGRHAVDDGTLAVPLHESAQFDR